MARQDVQRYTRPLLLVGIALFVTGVGVDLGLSWPAAVVIDLLIVIMGMPTLVKGSRDRHSQ